MYAAQATLFMQWSTENNASQVFDGLGMLIEQAAESFFIWRDIRPETSEVIKQLRLLLIN
jgi:shikimate dehydrogenase